MSGSVAGFLAGVAATLFFLSVVRIARGKPKRALAIFALLAVAGVILYSVFVGPIVTTDWLRHLIFKE
jgi:hypothetical protein